MVHFDEFHTAEEIPMAIMESLRRLDANVVNALQTPGGSSSISPVAPALPPPPGTLVPVPVTVPMTAATATAAVDNPAAAATVDTTYPLQQHSSTAIVHWSPETPAADYVRPDWLPTGNFANSATFQRAERSVFHVQASMSCPCCDFQILKDNTHTCTAGSTMVNHLVQNHREEYPWAVLCVVYEVELA